MASTTLQGMSPILLPKGTYRLGRSNAHDADEIVFPALIPFNADLGNYRVVSLILIFKLLMSGYSVEVKYQNASDFSGSDVLSTLTQLTDESSTATGYKLYVRGGGEQLTDEGCDLIKTYATPLYAEGCA